MADLNDSDPDIPSPAAAASSQLEVDMEHDSQPIVARSIPTSSSPNVPNPNEEADQPLVLNPTHFLLYRNLYIAGWWPNLIRNSVLVTLYIFLVIQLFATAKIAYLLHDRPSYPATCNHSGLIFVVTVVLRCITRFVFPLLLTLQFHYVLCRLNLAVDRGWKFLQEIQKDENFNVLQKVALILINIQIDTTHPVNKQKKKILQRVREDFSGDLHAMCLSSILEGFLLTFALIGLGAVHYEEETYPNKTGLFMLKCLDIISCLVLNIFCSLMLAFCFYELKLKYTITAVLEAENLVTADSVVNVTLRGSLKIEAEKIVNRLVLNWCAADIFMHLGTGVFSILLIISAVTGLPLSCGVWVHPDQLETDTQIQWLYFVMVTVLSHLLATSIFIIPLMRPVGITLEILGVLFIYYMYQEQAAYSQYLQILYAIFPACYCFWYHFAIVAYEFLFTYRCKTQKHLHFKKMVYSISLILLLVVALLVAVYTEYTNLAVDKDIDHAEMLSGNINRGSLAHAFQSDRGSCQEK